MSRLGRRAFGVAALSVVTAGAALVPAGVAVAAGGANLLANGTFDGGSTSGWKGTNASLSTVSPGYGGAGYAAKVSLSNTSTSYSIYAAPKPATAVPAGEQFQASGQVLGVAGRSICLLLQESAPGGSVVQTAKQCQAASGSWQAFGPVSLTNQTAGDTVGYLIRQTGAQADDSFQADSLSIVDVDTTAPTAPSGLTATAVSGNEVDLSWSAATDADFGGVYGYAVYRDGASTPLATTTGSVTAYKDTGVSSGSTHTYTVAAFDYAKNYSPPSNQASATTPSAPLAALWHMDETSGTTMVDSSGNANTGTLHNVMLGAVGVSGTAYTFGGATAKSYAEVPAAPSLNPSSANLHISFYLNTTSLPASGDYDLVRKGVYPGQEYKVELLQSGAITCVFRGSSANRSATGGSGLNNGAWHHIECIKTASQVQLVIDGTVAATSSGTVGSISNTYAVEIGAYPGSDWYKGKLDEVSITIG
jgi:hypothetical protein